VHRPIRPARLLLGLALVLGGLAACGNDDDATGTTDDAEVTDGADDGTDDEGAAGDDEVVEVELADYEFIGLPGTVPVGTTLTVTNSSEVEIHELVALRIPDAEERPVSELVTLPPEEAEAALAGGPPAMVLVAAPGGPQIAAVGDGTLTEAGRYAVVCMIPTGADPDEFLAAAAESDGPPDVPGGPPHLVHGMWAELLVE
jgi:hypothetical protein